MFCSPKEKAHLWLISKRYILYSSVCTPRLACKRSLLIAIAVLASLCQIPFLMRELLLGPEVKLEIENICSLHFSLTDTNGNQIISKCCPLHLSQSNKPCALFFVVVILRGGGKAGLGSLKRKVGARTGESFQLAWIWTNFIISSSPLSSLLLSSLLCSVWMRLPG